MEAFYPKNMCLKVFDVSLGVYVVLDKLPNMDWSYWYRIAPRCKGSMHVYVG